MISFLLGCFLRPVSFNIRRNKGWMTNQYPQPHNSSSVCVSGINQTSAVHTCDSHKHVVRQKWFCSCLDVAKAVSAAQIHHHDRKSTNIEDNQPALAQFSVK